MPKALQWLSEPCLTIISESRANAIEAKVLGNSISITPFGSFWIINFTKNEWNFVNRCSSCGLHIRNSFFGGLSLDLFNKVMQATKLTWFMLTKSTLPNFGNLKTYLKKNTPNQNVNALNFSTGQRSGTITEGSSLRCQWNPVDLNWDQAKLSQSADSNSREKN